MGVAQTGAIYKGFTFDGINSKQYGVYISGTAVFNAPERDVEMIEIPGRNGAYALDRRRFSNIEVTYPSGIFGDTDADFAQGISDLRNALASRVGYCRLEDEYNTNEYRLAVYKSGLEVEPAALKAGEFEIIFDCKPQRFLTSGETAQAVASGSTITNPTLFDAKPLIAVDGYGELSIGDYTVTIAQPETATTIYIDCDIMESYQEVGGEIQPVNSIITLSGHEYPVLVPGSNEITFGAGISSVTITPRWWMV